jgi:predicted transcriptional regulator
MKPVVNMGSNQTVLEAANLMNASGYSSLLIVDGKITVGIITARDLVIRAIAKTCLTLLQFRRSCHRLS